MELIIGGAYQGKLDYAKEEYGITDSDVFKCDETSTGIGFDERVIYHFEKYVLALMNAGQDPERTIRNMIPAGRFENRIIIADDISQGVVPTDEVDRAWRENTGRCLVMLAKEADKVTRIFCGIPLFVKSGCDENAATGKACAAQTPKTTGIHKVNGGANADKSVADIIGSAFADDSDQGDVIDVLTPHQHSGGGAKWGK